MQTLKETYTKSLVPKLMKEWKLKSPLAVPRITKVVINTGVTEPQDARERRRVIENVKSQLAVITGQQPKMTVARQSIAGFKLRAGDPLGVMVTLRGPYMWDFLGKLISVALPQVKDFRGVSPLAFDGQGNYSLGLEEQIVFPEVDYDKIDKVRSLQITIVTTAETDDQAHSLLEGLGMPFAKKE